MKIALSSGNYNINNHLNDLLEKNAQLQFVIIETGGKIHFSTSLINQNILRNKLQNYPEGIFLGVLIANSWSFYPLYNFTSTSMAEREQLIHDLINFISIISIENKNKNLKTHFNSILELLQKKNKASCNYLASKHIKNAILSLEKIGNNSKIIFDNWQDTWIQVSAIEIKRILLNLLKNADQAHEKRGIVGKIIINLNVKVLDDGIEYAVLSLRDQGDGICPDNMKRIFQEGFSNRSSSGLGLTIVMKILKKVGGFCQCNSLQGQGTEFSIFFPVVRLTRNLRIMIIENEQIIATDLKKKLKFLNENYEVIVFHSLHLARKFNGDIDILFLDNKLPEGRGAEIIPIIKKKNPKVKIISFSGVKCDGLKYYLEKPARLCDLFSLLVELS